MSDIAADDRFLFRLTLAMLHRARLDAASPEQSLRAEAGEFLTSDFARNARESLEGIQLGINQYELTVVHSRRYGRNNDQPTA